MHIHDEQLKVKCVYVQYNQWTCGVLNKNMCDKKKADCLSHIGKCPDNLRVNPFCDKKIN